ncbi:GGDEF domain-containing protein [Gallaecimonas kandeliae]|uniref:GGDEF domain-containing protein n=1 Tax=Gallaecimonas kandeliae TaxID=3029055 RepID=UPI0026481F37|nr:GGDEF domain-containing protein [Gallaecimonas kandeliae]WKE67343.1 GGDEF domain-containing protein [Gallaecimonas kandeliae]
MTEHSLEAPAVVGRAGALFALPKDEWGRILWKEIGCTCPIVEQTLHYLMHHDLQTGLPNLDLLMEKTNRALNQGEPCALLFLKVNGIVEIGEYQGVAAALHALRTCSDRIRQVIKGRGFAAHIHGELFAIVCDEPEPLLLAEQLWTTLGSPIPWQQDVFQLSVAVGVVPGRYGNGTAESLRYWSSM